MGFEYLSGIVAGFWGTTSVKADNGEELEDFEVLFADYYDLNGMSVFNGLIGLGYEPDIEG